MSTKKKFVTMIAALAIAGILSAQPASRETSDPAQRVNRQFEENSPAVGEKLPDIQLYDAKGHEFRLSDLKGSHSVLVFGCLT